MQTTQATNNTPRRVFVTGAGHGIGQAIVESSQIAPEDMVREQHQ